MSECPKGKWGKKPRCEDVGVCHNGTLINPRLQKQKNHCATCNPGYRLCPNKNFCSSENIGRVCVANKCRCPSGISVHDDLTCAFRGEKKEENCPVGCNFKAVPLPTCLGTPKCNVTLSPTEKNKLRCNLTPGCYYSGNGCKYFKDISSNPPFKPSTRCLKDNNIVCSSCTDTDTTQYYLFEDTLNKQVVCLKRNTCNNDEWTKSLATDKKDVVCVKCPANTEVGTQRTHPQTIKDCKCKTGHGETFYIYNNAGEVINVKCQCTNGQFKTINGEKTCVCNPDYYGGGKQQSPHKCEGKLTKNNYICRSADSEKTCLNILDNNGDQMCNYQNLSLSDNFTLFEPCIKIKKCKCENGSPATNIPCKKRELKTILRNNISNTDSFGECPIVNEKGEKWNLTMGSLKEKKNVNFKETKITCTKKDELLCESCMDGFVLNKIEIKRKGKLIPQNKTCISLNEEQKLLNPQYQLEYETKDTMKKQLMDRKIKKNPYKTIKYNNDTATMRRYNRMVQLNRYKQL